MCTSFKKASSVMRSRKEDFKELCASWFPHGVATYQSHNSKSAASWQGASELGVDVSMQLPELAVQR